KVVEAIAQHGVDEVVFYHDECYSTFTHYAKAIGLEVPFKPIHLFEFLYRRLRELEVKPLGLKVAYQRPCSSRLTPEKEHWVDDIFNLIGVERVEREYDRENALCCGSIFKLQGRYDLAVDVQRRNIEDMVKHGAEVCVFNCPNCYWTLSELVAKRGIKPLLMSQLCQLAIGERPKGWTG
ncbi:MAG: (Fe-S)-binding protein, partial [Thermoprotei archaeon]